MTPNRKREQEAVRLNRFLADAGFGSRRGVEDLVRQGRVSINGAPISELGTRVLPDRDEVMVDGVIVSPVSTGTIYAFHKPLGVVCTLKGQGGQPTLLPYKRREGLPEPVMPVGRLDADSSGLLLWTDSGMLNQALCRPGSGIWKTYAVTLAHPPAEKDVAAFVSGALELDGRPCLPCRLEPARRDGRAWLVHLHEGRKRQIRRMFRSLGNRVLTLHRVGYGPVKLGRLKAGGFRTLTRREVGELRKALAAAADDR